MDIKANYVAVGAFVLATVVGIVIALIWFAGNQYTEQFAYYQTGFTGSVTGLNKDTVVRYNGIEVGRVSLLQFDARDPRVVIATLQVDPSLRLRADSMASVETLGLTGGVYVEIAGGTPQAALLTAKPGQKYPVIPSKKSTLQQLSDTAPQLVANMNTAAQRAQDILNDDNRKAFAESLTNLAVASKQLQQTLTTTNMAVSNFGTASQSANTAAQNFGRASNSADAVIQETKTQLKDSIAQLHTLVTESREMVQSITRLSTDLDREPSKAIFGDRYVGYAPK